MLRKYNLDIILTIIFVCLVAYVIYIYFILPSYETKKIVERLTMEHFDNKSDSSSSNKNKSKKNKLKQEDYKLYQDIINIYYDILQINPPPAELLGFFERVKAGVIDLDELKYQLTDEYRQLKRIKLLGLTEDESEPKQKPKPNEKNIVKKESKKSFKKNNEKKKTMDDYDLDKDIEEGRVIKVNKTGSYSTLFDKNEEFVKKHLKELDESEQKKKALIIQNPTIYNIYNSDNNYDTRKKTTVDKLGELNAADISKIVYDEDGNLDKNACAALLDEAQGHYKFKKNRDMDELNMKCNLTQDQKYDEPMHLRNDQTWTLNHLGNRVYCDVDKKDKCAVIELPVESSLVGTFLPNARK